MANEKTTLDLDEQVSLSLTRREWAMILFAVAETNGYAPAQIPLLDGICAKVQVVAPVGVFVRAMRETHKGGAA